MTPQTRIMGFYSWILVKHVGKVMV